MLLGAKKHLDEDLPDKEKLKKIKKITAFLLLHFSSKTK